MKRRREKTVVLVQALAQTASAVATQMLIAIRVLLLGPAALDPLASV